MKPRNEAFCSKPKQELFRMALIDFIDESHPLVKLANAINWKRFDEAFDKHYSENRGRPAIPTRIMVGLHYLKHAFNVSDENVVERFKENNYWQYFCGNNFFEHEAPCVPTALVEWRKRIGQSGLEMMLQETLAVAWELGFLKVKEFKEVTVDTTVQEKNIAFPTDAKLLNKSRDRLVKEAKKAGLELRQNFNRVGKHEFAKYSRYSHARQFKRARKSLKKLKVYLGRVARDVRRKLPEQSKKLVTELHLAERLLKQEKKSKNKIYSLHEPFVDCISKGKVHKRYEFGCKASLATTNTSNWIVGAMAHHGNPYDGHTLNAVLVGVKRITGVKPEDAYVDKGYRGSQKDNPGVRVHISGTKRGKSKRQRKLLRRRSAIEPIIGHTKSDNRLGRNFLKGINGDHFNVILAAAGRNFSKLVGLIFLFRFFEVYFFFA
jgi:IS5 family transposase